MPTSDYPLALTAANKVLQIRDVLEQGNYAQPQICQLLGVPELPPATQRRQSLPLFRHRTRDDSPIAILIRLFHLGQAVSLGAARRCVAPMSLEDWADVGLLRVQGDTVTSLVELVPYERCVAAADWPENAAAGGSQVMGIAASSRTLAQMALWSSSGRTLDLGTGCGILALLAARQSDEVAAVDCNPRAIHFARFNAQLNRSSKITWSIGDFFESVRGQSFDLIVCNPPFVIGPQVGAIHSHGGQPADQLCHTLTRSAPAFLRDGGYFQMVLNWAQVAGQDWRDRLAGWCRESGCDALLMYSHVQDAAEYALQRIHELAGSADRGASQFDQWMAYFDSERIEGIGFGLLTLRRRQRGTNWFDCQQFLPGEQLRGDTIRRRLARRDFLQGHALDESLLGARLSRTEPLRWQQRHEPAESGWSLVESRLEVGPGRSPMSIDPQVVEFVSWCRGDRPVGEYVTRLAAASGQGPAHVTAKFLNVVRRLIEVGILEPATHDDST